MSERKVINKYYPPNFDPSKIPRSKKPTNVRDKRFKVRLMAPFSMQCNTCREYIYKGKKFNANKETVAGETYLSLKIFRFYIRCPSCHAEITFKTDPANTDYVAERGATRNYDGRRDQDAADAVLAADREAGESLDPLRALENRTDDSRREMDILDALDEMRARNARIESVDVDQVLAAWDRFDAAARGEEVAAEDDKEAELERLAREAFAAAADSGSADAMAALRGALVDGEDDDEEGPAPPPRASSSSKVQGPVVSRDEEDEDVEEVVTAPRRPAPPPSTTTTTAAPATKRTNEWASLGIRVNKKPRVDSAPTPAPAVVARPAQATASRALLVSYASDSE
ncbi:Pre-mRNA-splicing factor cwf16 [Blastocladiella emersonii ATCC 22665]|nr:Pre-mRNA-splicing factor cwf16 [Blastocladiella emersonii ATCC 22665]